MALEPGRGRTAVPVRSTILGTTFGVVALVAAVTFSLSLGHLLNTPRLFGWNWDAALALQSQDPTQADIRQAASMLRSDRRIDGLAQGFLYVDLKAGQRKAPIFPAGLSFDPVEGGVGPSILEGRAPTSADETVLGTDTLRSLGARIGGTVTLGLPGPPPRPNARFRVVGRLVTPSFLYLNTRSG